MQLIYAKLILTALFSGAAVLMISIAVGEPVVGGVFAAACAALAFLSPFASLGFCLVGAAAVMFLGGRPRGKTTSPKEVKQSVGGVKEPRFLISFITGPLSGATYTLSKATPKLDIGRDSSMCNVVFPSGTKGVGRHHCSIRLDGGRAVFTDVSTFGCYWVDSGQRIPKDTPLSLMSGTRIYLASSEIVMQIQAY